MDTYQTVQHYYCLHTIVEDYPQGHSSYGSSASSIKSSGLARLAQSRVATCNQVLQTVQKLKLARREQSQTCNQGLQDLEFFPNVDKDFCPGTE